MAATSGVIPLLYIIVRDRGTGRDGKAVGTARYTRGFLASTLQFMGCKSRHAVKVGVGLYLIRAGCVEKKTTWCSALFGIFVHGLPSPV